LEKLFKRIKLTEQQKAFLNLCVSDYSYAEIASIMDISIKTIETYRDILFNRFNIKSREGLAILAIQIGLTDSIQI